MNKDFEIIQAFDLPINSNDLDILKETHCYISDKLILDAINGINVVSKDLNSVSKTKEAFIGRTIDNFSGNAKKRQNLINENFIEGLSACAKWLDDHEKHISRIDTRICDVAYELDRTQDEILKFYKQHKNLKINVNNLEIVIQNFKESSINRMASIEEWLKDIDIRDRAYNHLSREISSLKAGKYDFYDIPIRIYTVLDNIKCGEAGVYYHKEKNLNEKNEFREYILNELKNYIKILFGNHHLNEFVDFRSILKSNNQLNEIFRRTMSFISTQHYNELIQEQKINSITDLVSITFSFEPDVAYNEIQKNSNISNFISYKDFIENSAKEHLFI